MDEDRCENCGALVEFDEELGEYECEECGWLWRYLTADGKKAA